MSRPATTLSDHDDRQLIREGLDETVIVEAAAGTGKTTELVWRMLNVLASGRAAIEQVVAVTFTEKAAGELKLRIRKELESLRLRSTDAAILQNLTGAIQRLEEAHVSTIHGFCADLLRERPVEAGIDPLFDVLTQLRADRLFDEAFRGWLHRQLESPPEGVRRALRRSVWSRDGRDTDDGPIDRLRRAARELAEWRDFTGAWRRDPFDRDAALARVLEHVHETARLTAAATSRRDPLYVDTRVLRDLAHDIDVASRFDAADPDGWEARAVDLAQNRDFRRARKGRGAYGAGVDRDVVWAAYGALTDELDAFQRAADADLAVLLHDELRGAIEEYVELKRRAGALDFVDLLLRARDLLAGHPRVRQAFQARFTHLFVDEFQDTDPLQAEILLLLSAGTPSVSDWRLVTPRPGKLFIVGDPKQAIYRFRRADVETYREVCELLEARGAKRAYLHTSFRSTPAIQNLVNAAFAPLLTGDRATLQAPYVALSPSREDPADQPSVIALPVPEPYGTRRIAGYAIDGSLPDAVGAFVHWLLTASGWTVTERTVRNELPMPVPIQPRHVCILFRRFLHFGDDVTRPYVEALEARGVRHLLVGGKSFHGREEVETIRAALAAVEWPDDELSVFATLRGALFAIDDETLLRYRDLHGGFHPFRSPRETLPELHPVIAALELLRRLHRRRNERPVADTLTDLLNATRAHVAFALRPAGEQSLANVLHIAELARQYETSGGVSFRGFVEELQSQADGGQAAEAPILEEGSDGVRLMTVHKAKGLEFPVVILADITAKLRGDRADRLIDKAQNACYLRLGRWTPIELAANEALEVARDEAEGVRVAYVAATRARDLLVVPAVGDATWDGGWTDPLNRAIYPELGARRNAGVASGCPAFSKDSVWRRPDDEPASPLTVCPGPHTFADAAGRYTVVWWDPHALELGAEPAAGIGRDTLIMKDVAPAIVTDGLHEYTTWRTLRADALAVGSAPSIVVRTATEWAASGDPLEMSVNAREAAAPAQQGLFDTPADVSDRAGDGDRGLGDSIGTDVVVVDARRSTQSGGPRFGELVHATLAVVPLDADRSTIEALAAVQSRVLAASEPETAEAVEVVGRVLAHPLLARARAADAAGSCRRESPVTLSVADGSFVEGVVDLAFLEAGEWTIVDYKTDRDFAGTDEAQYRRQVALYAAAIARATGQPARGVLIRL